MKIVIALGGNALGKTPNEQLFLVKETAKKIVQLIKDNNDVIITHGNGPQVGMINLAMDFAANKNVEIPMMPFAECGAMSQGYIGYHLQQAISNELANEKIDKNCATVITQVEVSKDDLAFKNPTKPVGMFYSKEEAEKIKGLKKYQFMEDSGRGYRRVVASPIPIKIIEKDIIHELINSGNIVIAVGGGGIPVYKDDDGYHGIDAVIDKDRSSAQLAIDLNADMLLILTAVDKVCLNYGKKNEIVLNELTIEKCENYIKEGQFAKGSMLPKIEACMEFVIATGHTAIITSLLSTTDAIKGISGTKINK